MYDSPRRVYPPKAAASENLSRSHNTHKGRSMVSALQQTLETKKHVPLTIGGVPDAGDDGVSGLTEEEYGGTSVDVSPVGSAESWTRPGGYFLEGANNERRDGFLPARKMVTPVGPPVELMGRIGSEAQDADDGGDLDTVAPARQRSDMEQGLSVPGGVLYRVHSAPPGYGSMQVG